MKNKKQKIIAIMLVTFILLFSISKVFAYNVQITKANLTDAFNAYAKSYTDGYPNEDGNFHLTMIDPSTPIQVTDTQLIDKNDEDITYYIDYSLNNTPTFSIKTEINRETNLKDIYNLEDFLKKPLLGLIGTSIVQGRSVVDAWGYHLKSKLTIKPYKIVYDSMSHSSNQLDITIGNSTTIFNQDDFSPSELVTFLFEEQKVISDEEYGIYVYTVTTSKTGDDSYTIEAKLEINPEADFSKIERLTSKPLSEDNTTLQNNITNNQQESVNKVTNSITKLPQTGDSFGLKTGLYLLCITSSIVLIFIIFKSVKYRNIEK